MRPPGAGGRHGRVEGSRGALCTALDVLQPDRATVLRLGVALCDAAAGLTGTDLRKRMYDRFGAIAGQWAAGLFEDITLGDVANARKAADLARQAFELDRDELRDRDT